MKNKSIQVKEKENKEDILSRVINRPTPRLDKLASDFYKILSATAAKFIPDACRALMQDWQIGYDTLTNPRYKPLRDEMREKILDRFSKDREPRSIWNDDTVEKFFIEEFRNPIQVESTKGALKKANATLARKYQEKIGMKSSIFEKLAKELPEPPKEHVEPKSMGYDQGPRQVRDTPLFMKVGGTGKTIIRRFGEIFGPVQDLVEGITGDRSIPTPDEDRLNEYIKPTRDEFMTVYYEVEDHSKIALYNSFTYLKELLEDRLRLMEAARRK